MNYRKKAFSSGNHSFFNSHLLITKAWLEVTIILSPMTDWWLLPRRAQWASVAAMGVVSRPRDWEVGANRVKRSMSFRFTNHNYQVSSIVIFHTLSGCKKNVGIGDTGDSLVLLMTFPVPANGWENGRECPVEPGPPIPTTCALVVLVSPQSRRGRGRGRKGQPLYIPSQFLSLSKTQRPRA